MTRHDYAHFRDDPLAASATMADRKQASLDQAARPADFDSRRRARHHSFGGGNNDMPTGTLMRKTIGLGIAATGMLCAFVSAASAQDISDKAVEAFMEYAWSMTPSKFTKPSGAVVEVNKKERDKVVVPNDVAREIIRAGRLTAHAQLCDLGKEQVLNYRSLMQRESDKKKWSEQQMIYINQLHLTTVMLLTGKIKLIEEEGGGKQPVVEDTRAADAKSCTDEQRKKVGGLIEAYLKSGPAVSLDAPAGALPEAAVAPAAAKPAAAAPTPAAAPTAAPANAPPAKKP
jgi:hypothetical protein